MNDTVVSIENLSKQYRLGLVGAGTIKDDLKRCWARMLGREDPYSKVGQANNRTNEATDDWVWALKDISLEIGRGDVLGLIGKNGAGKSTLLKLISRITAPTEGYIRAKGRIASLLEVGTGMHPEMTGRQNIFLNGSILGMKHQEIQRKLDDIVAFSGCQMYIDTPVKRYSSGMRVRLGFAVAAFLEPEILVVDEVLAVGDAEFQSQAVGKMQEVTRDGGRTIIFVSHNMAAVRQLCHRGVVIDNGRVALDSNIGDAVEYYLKLGVTGTDGKAVFEQDDGKPTEITSVVVEQFGEVTGKISNESAFRVVLEVRSECRIDDGYVILKLRNSDGVLCLHADSRDSNLFGVRPGNTRFVADLPGKVLAAGEYFITVAVRSHSEGLIHNRISCCSFMIENLVNARGERDAVLCIEVPWDAS